MNLKGIITRKENDTGLTLEAKVVSPKGKIYGKKKFKVRVLKNALSDLTCVILDRDTIQKNILNNNDLENLDKNGITNMGNSGEYGSSYSYWIEHVSGPTIGNYLSNSGDVTDRPKYGEGNSQGILHITITKGSASLSLAYDVIVKQISAAEVFASQELNASHMWERIKGKNSNWVNNSTTSGNYNIQSNLSLINSVEVPELSSVPVQIQWNAVTDQYLTTAYANGVLSNPAVRVTDTGEVTKVPYALTYKTISSSTVSIEQILPQSAIDAREIRLRIHGLTLSYRMKLTDSSNGSPLTETSPSSISIPCATLSKYVTDDEVFAAIDGTIPFRIREVDATGADVGNALMASRNIPNSLSSADSELTNIQIPTDLTHGLRLEVPKDTLTMAVSSLGLPSGYAKAVIEPSIRDYDGSERWSEYSNVFITPSGGTGTYYPEEIDGASCWCFMASAKKLRALVTDNGASGYTNNARFSIWFKTTVGDYSDAGDSCNPVDCGSNAAGTAGFKIECDYTATVVANPSIIV